MRQLYVTVRWAAAAVAVAATTGCMSIGDDGSGTPAPARSAGERSGDAVPDGGSVSPGGARGPGADGDRKDGDGKGGKGGKDGKKGRGDRGGGGDGKKATAGHGKGAVVDGEPSRGGNRGGSSVTPTSGGGRPTPSRTRPGPAPTRSTPPPEPSSPTPTPTQAPTSPEPSSSAHGGVGEPAGRGEPSPQAGPA
ncbi:hypothetical protein [Streptomyces aureocirculatus]|uniref:hypothetical protein n=1 Tax=Streptomyces aureocirculatus TaxID=67275 RepID=UPI0004CA3622|nr:hypothetical protein [Streptomyces aureocirculatus]